MARDTRTSAVDPVRFCESLRDPETGRPFVLTDAERRFLAHAFAVGDDGRLLFPELLFSAPKKSGKTTLAAMVTLYAVLVLGGRYAEGYAVANDYEQARGRVWQQVERIVRATPELDAEAHIVPSSALVEFPATGATIRALASDYSGAAGSNPVIVTFDELWAYTSEPARRLWDELVPPPTRALACRLTVTYAGYEGESALLEELVARGTAGELIGEDLYAGEGQLSFVTHRPVAPWQTESWLCQMRRQLRPNAYLRMIENRFVSSESAFVPLEDWDACVDPEARPAVQDPELPVFVGLDASVKRDQTAIVACAFDREAGKVRVVWHRVFRPTPDDPLDFEATVEATLRELRQRFRLREVRYDPWALQAVAQRLERAGLRMREFPQSLPNLTEASTNLYELIRGRGLVAYASDELRGAIQAAVAKETSRGWRLAKDKAGAKIDAAVALSMAALAAVQGGQRPRVFLVGPGDGTARPDDPEKPSGPPSQEELRACAEAGWTSAPGFLRGDPLPRQ